MQELMSAALRVAHKLLLMYIYMLSANCIPITTPKELACLNVN